jgi:hypothetical protein
MEHHMTFDTKEEAEAYAKEHNLDVAEIYQGPFVGDTKWVIGVWLKDDEE